MMRIGVAACIALLGMFTPAAAQHEQHGASVRLDTLTVRAERDVIVLRSGATVVNARASAAAGGSIADVLRTVPGIEVDAEGRISMRGSTSVLVLINGRRSLLTGDALVAFLRQMPATSVERIEAGTAASARQDADGAGVVNLIFRDDAVRRTGMYSLAGSSATDDHYMGSGAVRGHVRDILSWDVMYSVSGLRPRTDSKTARWSVVPGDLDLHTDQATRAREKHRLHSVMAGLTVTPIRNASLALRGNHSWMEGAYRNSNAFLYTNTAGDSGTSRTRSLLEHVIPSGGLSAVARLDRERVGFTSEAGTSFVDEDFRGDHVDVAGGHSYMSKVMTARQREHVLRNDLALRFARVSLDLGHESRFRTSTAAHDETHFNATVSRTYRYELEVHAGYLAAHRSIGGVRAEAGLRVEAERTDIQLEDTTSTGTAVRLFPSISGKWTDARRFLVYRIAYGRRINRPGAEMLNPFAMGDEDMNEIIGNPSLLPEISDQIEFGIERPGSRLTLQLTPFLRWTRDPIRPLKNGTASGRAKTTLQNLERSRAIGADGSVRARPTDRAVVTLASSVAHMETTADAFSSSGVHATARLTVDFQVAHNTAAQLYAFRRSAQVIEQGEILPAFTSELALTQRLARDRMRVTLRIIDPLRSDRLEFRIADADFTEQSRRHTARPLLSLFASYAVGGAPREDPPGQTERPVQIF